MDIFVILFFYSDPTFAMGLVCVAFVVFCFDFVGFFG